MSLPWFRVYSRIIDDKKLKLLAFEDRWHFVALCALKCSGELDDPDFSLRVKQVAIALGLSTGELDLVLKRLREVKLIDEEMHPIKWDSLQFKNDSSKERTRKWREKKAKQKQSAKKDVTVRDVTVTVQDTDTDTEVISPKGDCASGDALKVEHVIGKWNEVAVRLGKPRVVKVTPARRQLVKARIGQFTLPEFIEVFGKVERSKFLREWKNFSFDWMMKSANFVKIFEGNYDD